MGGVGGWGWGGGGVQVISSNDILCHLHSHPLSHHIGKILDGQSLIIIIIRRISFIVAKELSRFGKLSQAAAAISSQ